MSRRKRKKTRPVPAAPPADRLVAHEEEHRWLTQDPLCGPWARLVERMDPAAFSGGPDLDDNSWQSGVRSRRGGHA